MSVKKTERGLYRSPLNFPDYTERRKPGNSNKIGIDWFCLKLSGSFRLFARLCGSFGLPPANQNRVEAEGRFEPENSYQISIKPLWRPPAGKPDHKKISFLPLILIWFCLSPAKADRAWIRPPDTHFKSFKAHVAALGNSHKTYGEYRLSLQRKKAGAFQLIRRIQTAQELYLSGTLKSAEEAFQKIARLAHSADWNEEDRRIMLYAFLRSAQITGSPDIKKALLLSAVQFFRKPITPRHADYNLFPPPLTEQFNELLRTRVFFTVNWKKVFPEHEIILVNGEMIPSDKPSKIPSGVHRVTALSSSHIPYSQVIRLSRLISRPANTKPLTTGACRALRIASEWEAKTVRLLKPECPPPLKFVGPMILPEKPPAEKRTVSQNTLSLVETSTVQKMETPEKISSVPKWVWIAGGTVVAGLVLHLSYTHGEKSSPPVFYY